MDNQSSKPPKAPPASKIAFASVTVVIDQGKIVIGGRILQGDEDPLDLIERYFEAGEPNP